ncbi:hypothetical protein JG687_00018790 [Phytophthora cactorum]|uniref:Uncharacterized protein n=1 Tax=Phytophthora cactorum TaxID=29920 RepID=A0A8T1TPM9_9STRA|nr:hypothetical protein JG687_00018790 [Phytophthora cactorum]
MKASYVHDVNYAAILASIFVPTVENPFLSVVSGCSDIYLWNRRISSRTATLSTSKRPVSYTSLAVNA